MKRFSRTLGIVLLGMTTLAFCVTTAQAGRLGGPITGSSTILGTESVFYDMTFIAGQPAIIRLVGNQRTILHLFVYDGDGNIIQGEGIWDRKTATINVYRTGVFRIEVRNMGIAPNTFTISTN